MNYDGIIFDVDGTLWYSCEQVAACWSEVATEILGRPCRWTAQQMEKEFGKTMDVILSDLLPELDAAQREKLGERCMEEENRYLRRRPGVLYPGVAETLRRLAEKHRLFIVSNCQKGYIETLLDAYGLAPCFEGWLCWGDTGREKQDTLRILSERYGLEKPVYVGDTQGDANACAAADIDMIFTAYGLGQVENPAAVIHGFDELPGLLDESKTN